MKELLRQIFLVDLLKGLRLTFSYQRPSATYTETAIRSTRFSN